MNKKELLIGFLIGILANVFGLFLAVNFLGTSDDYTVVIQNAIAQGFFGKLISMGALLNLGAFFLFIKKKQDKRAQGVLIATILVMLITFGFKFLS